MGYNTAVLVLNDSIHEIAKDPDFGWKVAQAAANFGKTTDISVGGHVNAATVYSAAHADVVQVMAFGGNHASTLMRIHNGGRHYTSEEQVELIRHLADQYGFRLVKKSKK